MKLEEAGLLEKEKRFKGITPQTLLRLTPAGRDRVRDYWQRLQALRKAATRWRWHPSDQATD
jgi:hypothetical protein